MRTFRLKYAHGGGDDIHTPAFYRVIDGETGKPITSALPYWLAMKHMRDFERGQKIVDQLIPMEAASRDTRGVLASVWATGSYIVGALALIGAIAWATPANADHKHKVCVPLTQMVADFAVMYDEAPYAAMQDEGISYVLFRSDNLQTWTWVRVDETGEACIQSFGTGFAAAPVSEFELEVLPQETEPERLPQTEEEQGA